jgi:GNAT superfamily N-acetyltransferase
MQLIAVTSDQLFKAFLDVPKLIYVDDKEYIPHIRQEIQHILWDRPQPGEVGLWLVEHNDQYVGRIAAFINPGNKGGLGFFESIDNSEVAKLLLETGEQWLRDKHISVIEAPVNYGERDKFWGLLVKGFKNPSYQEPYNPAYYRRFFEDQGYTVKIVQSTQEVTPALFNVDKIGPLAAEVEQNPDLELRHIEKDKLDKYASDFVTIYNKAWKQHEHFVPLTVEKVGRMMKAMKPVLREDLVWFTYVKGEPVAFYVSIIEINEIFRYLNGNLNGWGKLKFLYYRWRKPITRIRGLVFGVVPEYQGMGITSGMMMKVFDVFKKYPQLKTSERAWIRDFNPGMMKFLEAIGAHETKQHITFEKKI